MVFFLLCLMACLAVGETLSLACNKMLFTPKPPTPLALEGKGVGGFGVKSILLQVNKS